MMSIKIASRSFQKCIILIFNPRLKMVTRHLAMTPTIEVSGLLYYKLTNHNLKNITDTNFFKVNFGDKIFVFWNPYETKPLSV